MDGPPNYALHDVLAGALDAGNLDEGVVAAIIAAAIRTKKQRKGRRVAKLPRTDTAAQRRFRKATQIYKNI